MSPTPITKRVNANCGISEEIVCWLLELSVLATSEAISGQVPTHDIVHSWQHYSAAPLGDHATRTMTWYPIQSHIILTLRQPVLAL